MFRYLTSIVIITFSLALNAQETDTASVKVTRQWTLSEDFTEEVDVPVDTMFSLFNRHKSADKYSPFNAYTGNYGLPLYQINFFDRPSDQGSYLYNYYFPFMHLPGNPLFLNTKVPFTELLWTFGAPRSTSEQTFRVRHSQNVNRYFNLGLIFDVTYSIGQYSYQLSDNKDFLFHTSYTRDRYKMYFAAGINNLNSYENGGVIDGADLSIASKEIPVNFSLNKAKSILKNKNLLLVQKFTIGKKTSGEVDAGSEVPAQKGLNLNGTFSHIMSLETNNRLYIDRKPASGFYDSIYIDNALTYDSLYSRSLNNTVRFDFSSNPSAKFRFGAGFGFRNELEIFSQIVPSHNLTISDTLKWNKSSNAILGKVYNNIGDKFRWVVDGDLYFTGYKAGGFNLKGEIEKTFIQKKGESYLTLYGGLSNTQPSFWYDNWGSNNFEWKNNFLKELRINTGSQFLMPSRRLALKMNFAVINNYIGFGTDAFPSQQSSAVSVASVSAEKEFILWKLHFAGNVLIQKSSNPEVIDLPLVALKSALYFEHNFFFKLTNGHLNTQLGADVFYNTAYHGYAYMPATGRYYRQNTISTGNYPYINVFLNIKLKRTRIVIMFDHVNSGMMGYDYLMVPTYPMNIRMLKYGLAWTFYD